jgi:hypothetical protein
VTTPAVAEQKPATRVIIDFISSLGWPGTQETGYPLLAGAYIHEEPDRCVIITGTGGPGYVTEEGSLDAVTFQARTRGTANDPDGPEAAAQLLDSLVLGASFPAEVDSITISHVHRAAGRPAPLPVDPSELRHEFTCNYVAIMGV